MAFADLELPYIPFHPQGLLKHRGLSTVQASHSRVSEARSAVVPAPYGLTDTTASSSVEG